MSTKGSLIGLSLVTGRPHRSPTLDDMQAVDGWRGNRPPPAGSLREASLAGHVLISSGVAAISTSARKRLPQTAEGQ